MARLKTQFFFDGGLRCQKLVDTVVTMEGTTECGDRRFVVCFTGGWRTSTTKSRINDITHGYGWSVYQSAGRWFASYFGSQKTVAPVPFKEGLALFEDGEFGYPA